MPFTSPTYHFVRRHKRTGRTMFEAPLEKSRCAYANCRLLVSIGKPYCARHRRQVQGLEIKRSVGLASIGVEGAGVYATRAIEPEQVVAYYECSRVDERQMRRLYGKRGTRVYSLSDNETDLEHGGDGSSADAALDRCIASLINDSHGLLLGDDYSVDVEPNVYFCDQSQPYAIRALRRIEPGEELYLSYGADYWNGFEAQPYVCETIRVPSAAAPASAKRQRPNPA